LPGGLLLDWLDGFSFLKILFAPPQLPDGLLDYSSFVETFYDLLASVPSVSDELEQVQPPRTLKKPLPFQP
jgi:hypothetical protein